MRLPDASHRVPEPELTPLINIVFLLLIFFMIAGTLAARDALTVTPATAAHGESARPARSLVIGADGRLALDGQALSLAQARTRLGGADRPGVLFVKPDRALPATTLLEILGELDPAEGGYRIELLARREA